MEKIMPMMESLKSFVLANPFMATMFILGVVAVATGGCAYLKTVDKYKVAYDVGKAATSAYLSEKDQLSLDNRQAVEKVWEAYKDNMGKITVANIKTLPDLLKAQVGRLPEGPVRTKALALVDKYWNSLNKALDLTGTGGEDLVKVLNGLRDGIQASLDGAAK